MARGLVENMFHVSRKARRAVHEPDLHDTCRLPSRRMRQTADREFGRNAEYGVQRAAEVRSFLEILEVFINLFLNFSRSLYISEFLIRQSHEEILIAGLPSGRRRDVPRIRRCLVSFNFYDS